MMPFVDAVETFGPLSLIVKNKFQNNGGKTVIYLRKCPEEKLERPMVSPKYFVSCSGSIRGVGLAVFANQSFRRQNRKNNRLSQVSHPDEI